MALKDCMYFHTKCKPSIKGNRMVMKIREKSAYQFDRWTYVMDKMEKNQNVANVCVLNLTCKRWPDKCVIVRHSYKLWLTGLPFSSIGRALDVCMPEDPRSNPSRGNIFCDHAGTRRYSLVGEKGLSPVLRPTHSERVEDDSFLGGDDLIDSCIYIWDHL